MGEALSQLHRRLELDVDSSGIVVNPADELGLPLHTLAAFRCFPVDATVYYEQGAAPTVEDVNVDGDTFDLTHDGAAYTAGNIVTGGTSGAVGLINRVIDGTTLRVILQDFNTPFTPVEVITETPGPETSSLTVAVAAPVQSLSPAYEKSFMLDYEAIGPVFAFRCASGTSTKLVITPVTNSQISTHRVSNGFANPVVP